MDFQGASSKFVLNLSENFSIYSWKYLGNQYREGDTVTKVHHFKIDTFCKNVYLSLPTSIYAITFINNIFNKSFFENRLVENQVENDESENLAPVFIW